MSTAIRDLRDQLTQELGRVVIGVEASVEALVIALIARGHVLVQGVPGLGKTLFAKALARALGGEFKRIQGTADLMPSDIIGVHVFDEAARNFAFRPGPLFADVVLVDEINRAGPKTQSALLEAMEERQVSVERSVLPLPADFIVLATQNPREFEGTFPLPESQLDRFMLRIDMGYPARDAETAILTRYGGVLAAAHTALEAARARALNTRRAGTAQGSPGRCRVARERVRDARRCQTGGALDPGAPPGADSGSYARGCERCAGGAGSARDDPGATLREAQCISPGAHTSSSC